METIKTQFFTLFPVEKKNQAMPDYRMSVKSEGGNYVDVGAVWLKEGTKGKFLSGKFSDGLTLIGEVEPYQKKEVAEAETKKVEVNEEEIGNYLENLCI